MAKQSRLAGFLGLERYQGAETTPEESPQAVQAETRREANASAGQVATAQKTDSSHRLSALPGSEQYSVAESHAGSQGETYHLQDEPAYTEQEEYLQADSYDDGTETEYLEAEESADGRATVDAAAYATAHTPETTADLAETEQTWDDASADNWEDTPVPNTEYTEQYAETYSNDGYYDQGYEPEETNGYTYGYEEEEDELRRITTIHPRSYNDAKIIGEAFRENIPVIMNVEEMPDADAKRLVDFASGLAFALEGRIERVTAKVFLLTPSNLEVLGVANSEVPAGFETDGEFPFDQG